MEEFLATVCTHPERTAGRVARLPSLRLTEASSSA